MTWKMTVCAGLFGLAAVTAAADVQLPKVINDHMVLQRNADAAIWGWASPGESVRVQGSWMPDARSAETGSDGRWLVRVPTPDAGGPYTITISGENSITLSDVLIGEVWMCSGQSNMEFAVAQLTPEDMQATLADADDDQLRLFEVSRAVSLTPRADCQARPWGSATSDRVRDFSAVAYFYAKKLRTELGVPVGLIESDWGGTRVEAWMSPEGLAPFEEYRDDLTMIRLATTDPGARARMLRERTEQWWQALDAGTPDDWTAMDFDDGSWKNIDIPSHIASAGLNDFDGVVYFRHAVDLPSGWEGKPITLSLGPIDDYDDVWFNGVHVGETHNDGMWNSPRKYEVPANAVHGGANTIAVRMLDQSGPGGIFGDEGQLYIREDDMLVPIAGSWKFKAGSSLNQLKPRPEGLNVGPNTATALYHGMITPILPYTIRGVIWYQGEANVGNAAAYGELFPAMIKDWRRLFASGDVPFYYVQIAPWEYGNDTGQAARLRDSQRTTLSLENTGMAVTLDIGNPKDIHPKDKRDVGDRLARWALAKTYGRTDIVYSGPLYESSEATPGKMRLHFAHADGGLVAPSGSLTHFTIAGADHQFRPAQAKIDGDTVLVWSDSVPDPVAVRYCWGAADEGTLFNGAGLPASSFRTDNWD